MHVIKAYNHQQNKGLLLIGFILAVLPLFTSCKKESKSEETPVFGTCQSVAPTGHLTKTGTSGPYVYRTSGGGTITINQANTIITHDNYPGFKIEFWGDAGPVGQPMNSGNHENLNGKHIKDRIDVRRTIVFPDGAKMTMLASGFAGPPISIRIYEGDEIHVFNTSCITNTLEFSSANTPLAKQLENAEPDGETGTFEFTTTGLLYVNIYTENTPGNKVMNRVLLGELDRSNPTQVRDYYDDPRLGHT